MKQRVILTNPSNNELVAKILAVIGTVCDFEVVSEEGYADDRYDFKFPEAENADGDTGLIILGDDSWGAVRGAWMDGNNLLLMANFGDDGDYLYCPTISKPYEYGDWWVNALSENNIARISSL